MSRHQHRDHIHFAIETDQAGHDLNRVTAILHKEIDRGYVTAGQVVALAELVTSAREKAAEEKSA